MAPSGRDVKAWSDGKAIATTHASSFGENAEPEANARLIAAAPDLLAALQDVIYLSTGIPDAESSYLANAALVKVRAAIEKATT